MTDDPTKTAHDRRRVNIHQDYELDYWTKELGISKERLRQLVSEHGDRVDDLRRALKQHA